MAIINKTTDSKQLSPDAKEKLLKKRLKKVLKNYGVSLSKKHIIRQGSMSNIYNAKDKKGNKLIVKCVIIDRKFKEDTRYGTREVLDNDKKAFETEFKALDAMKDSDYCVHLYDTSKNESLNTVKKLDYFKIEMTKRYYAYGLIEYKYDPFITDYKPDSSLGYSVAVFSDLVNKWSKIYSADCVAAWIGLCISRSFADMKKNNISAHRDIKPSNILIDTVNVSNMFDCRFVLADFGIAYLNDCNNEKARNARVGTPAYRPSEQYMSHDWRDDQYMLGKTLCEYYGVLQPSVGGCLKLEDSSLWGESFKNNKYGVRDIIFKMIKDSPEERYQTIDELFTAFESVLKKIENGKFSSYIPEYGDNTNSHSIFCNKETVKSSPSSEEIPVRHFRSSYKKFEVNIPKDKIDFDFPVKNDTITNNKLHEKQNSISQESYNQFCTLIKKGRTEEARRFLNDNNFSEKNFLTHRMNGICYYFEGKKDSAKQCFESIQKTDIVSAYYCYALETDDDKKFLQLQNIFLKMDSMHPFYPAVCYNLYKNYKNTFFVEKYRKTIKTNKKKISAKKLLSCYTISKNQTTSLIFNGN